MAEMDQWGGWQRGYVYMGQQLLALQQYSGVEWVHQDFITKSQRLTNLFGAVTSLVDLDPWGGETAASVSQFRQPQRYTTYLRDANGSDEAHFRRYNRWWSRFDQPDPYDGAYDLTNPQSLNRYAYVNNDPVNFIDPTGLFCVWISTTGRDSDGFLRTEWRLDCSFFYGGGGRVGGSRGGDDRGRGGGGRRTRQAAQELTTDNRETYQECEARIKAGCEESFKARKREIVALYGTLAIIDGVIFTINLLGNPEPISKTLLFVGTGLVGIGLAISAGIDYSEAVRNRRECNADAYDKCKNQPGAPLRPPT